MPYFIATLNWSQQSISLTWQNPWLVFHSPTKIITHMASFLLMKILLWMSGSNIQPFCTCKPLLKPHISSPDFQHVLMPIDLVIDTRWWLDQLLSLSLSLAQQFCWQSTTMQQNQWGHMLSYPRSQMNQTLDGLQSNDLAPQKKLPAKGDFPYNDYSNYITGPSTLSNRWLQILL